MTYVPLEWRQVVNINNLKRLRRLVQVSSTGHLTYCAAYLLCRPPTVPLAYCAARLLCRPPTVPLAYCAARLLCRLLTSGAVAPHACLLPALSRLLPAYYAARLLCRLIFDLPIDSLLTRYASVTEPA